MANSMNKARQCFEAHGISAQIGKDTCREDLLRERENSQEGGNRQHESCVAELFASKCKDLPGAAIDAHGVRITPMGFRCGSRNDSGEAANAFCLEPKKFGYNGRIRYR